MQIRKYGQALLATLVLTGLPAYCLADESETVPYYLTSGSPNLSSYIKSYESVKYSNRFKIKGWQVREDVYMGGAKIAGEYGPGVVYEKGDFAWGFNHNGVAIELRF